MGGSARFVRSITGAGALADTAGYSPDLNYSQKLQVLETFDVVERLKLSLQFQRDRLAELQVRKRIREDVEDGAQKQQREYFLRKQMDAIRKELGETDGSVTEEYRTKIAGAGMPEAVRQQAERELDRFERMGDSNAESSMIRTYPRLAAGGALGEAVRRSARPRARRGRARCRPRRPGGREAAHHGVPSPSVSCGRIAAWRRTAGRA